MWIDGQLVFSESDIVKMCVVLVPIAWIMLIAVIGSIVEVVSDYKHRNDCKGEEWQELLKYMTED